MIDKPKARVLEKCSDVLLSACGIVIHAEHLMTAVEEALAQV